MSFALRARQMTEWALQEVSADMNERMKDPESIYSNITPHGHCWQLLASTPAAAAAECRSTKLTTPTATSTYSSVTS